MSFLAGANSGAPAADLPVLVVDDDMSIRHLFSIALQRAGYSTAEASNGREALAMIESNDFCAVLLDNHMPEMDGLDVIRSLRDDEETATLPIILVTGASEVADRVQGLQAGASDYLTKPVELDELVARVRTQLRWQAAWMHKVEGHLRERAAIARALAQIKPADTPEATAAIVCFELSLLHQLKTVAMFAFGERDIVVPIGRHGEPLFGESVNEPLDPATSRYLLDKAEHGPWTDRSLSLRAITGRQSPTGIDTALAFAPMIGDNGLLGLLVLSCDTNDVQRAGSFAHILSATIDFASVASGLLAPGLSERGRDTARHGLLDQVLENREFFPVFQPIVDLTSRTVVGYETLTRFMDGMRPDLRFIEASLLGRGADLEIATLTSALEQAGSLPSDAFLSVNVSPALVMENRRLPALLSSVDRQIVLELTEHERVDDYGALRDALQGLGPEVRISVDDAGSGFASLRHVLTLQPHFVKLDLSLVRGIHLDPARQALVAGIEYFATETDSRLIAEGIETDEEMEALQRLDVELGQGYLLGKPAPLPA